MSAPNPATPTSSAPFTASAHAHDGKTHLLLAATGSVATIKLPLIARTLSDAHATSLSIRILLTPSATHFLAGQSAEQPRLATLLELPAVDAIHTDAEEWTPAWTRGAPILHIELRRWADVMLVAPLSANSMAKMVGGWADGLVLSVLRAWDTDGLVEVGENGERGGMGRKKRVLVAPAMNTAMWRHPVTERQMGILEREWGVDVGGWVEVLRPVEKELACGDTGDGAMRDWREIVRVVEQGLGLVKGKEG
ncbi:MAG: hypothetical protein M1833_004857 [Piccolia ochrophora]|nr:MAG: hypothetical protein M1833_004857 [Piccolia ochrophora]